MIDEEPAEYEERIKTARDEGKAEGRARRRPRRRKRRKWQTATRRSSTSPGAACSRITSGLIGRGKAPCNCLHVQAGAVRPLKQSKGVRRGAAQHRKAARPAGRRTPGARKDGVERLICGNERWLRELVLAFLQDCDLRLSSRKKSGKTGDADLTSR